MFTDEIINNYITTFCLEARPYEYNFKSKFHLKKVYDFLIIIVVYYRKFFFYIRPIEFSYDHYKWYKIK